MSLSERRAWRNLLSMCPIYVVYFALLATAPALTTTFFARISLLALVATIHAVLAIAMTVFFMAKARGLEAIEDERDRAIDGRATRIAYFTLLSGMILVGCVLPFSRSGWALVNLALLVIVIAEGLRQTLIILGYRSARLAF